MTTEDECLAALRTAAERLGTSPTKAEYEDLGLTPAASTILRVMGSWNEAKEAAGLERYEQGENGGREVEPKPEWVEIPKDSDWEAMSGNMRWYYKNRERDIAAKDRRRAALRRWVYEYKQRNCKCTRCGEAHPAALDFHHVDADEKEFSVSRMVNRGFSKTNILAEMEKCEPLCANCHRKEHYEVPTGPSDCQGGT